MESFGPGASHAMSRYFAVTEGLIEVCQQAYLSGRDLKRTGLHLGAEEVTVIAVESLEADHLLQSLPQVVGKHLPSESGDWAVACLAELLLQSATDAPNLDLVSSRVPDQMRRDAWDALERVLDSPTASPMLWYEDIYFDVAQENRIKNDLNAIELIKRGLVWDLRYNEGNNADGTLRDLAEFYLWLDQLDQGLTILTGLLYNDPGDVWTYNTMAFILGAVGLVDLGLEATQRALELIEATGDPEKLYDQLTDALDRIQSSEKRGRETETDPSVLAEMRAALALDLNAGWHKPVADLCQELVPDLARVPVKRELTVSDLTYSPAQHPQPSSTMRKLGRNDLCWCGSGKKYKQCHLREDRRMR